MSVWGREMAWSGEVRAHSQFFLSPCLPWVSVWKWERWSCLLTGLLLEREEVVCGQRCVHWRGFHRCWFSLGRKQPLYLVSFKNTVDLSPLKNRWPWQTMVVPPDRLLQEWLWKSLMKMTTNLSSCKSSTRSDSQSEKSRTETGTPSAIPSTGWSLPTKTKVPTQKSPTASKRAMSTENFLLSPKPDWCHPRSFLELENTIFFQWVKIESLNVLQTFIINLVFGLVLL